MSRSAATKAIVIAASIIFSALVLAVDVRIGPFIRMPILFVLPVAAVSWCCGLVIGVSLAIGLPVLRLLAESGIPTPWTLGDSAINTVILASTLSLISFLVYYVNRQRRRIRVLQGFLPICSFCKKIRTPEKNWEQMETYITQHSHAEFTHSLCPECTKKHYGSITGEGTSADGQR